MDSEEITVGLEEQAQPEAEAVGAGQEASAEPVVETETGATATADADAAPETDAVSGELEAETEGESSEAAGKAARPLSLDDLKPGMRLKGKVRNLVDFGAFVDVGVGRDGLAHISTLKRAGIDKTVKVGDVIDVQVRRVDTDGGRISLTIPGAGKTTKTSLSDLEPGAVVTGRVMRLVDFGAFVDIDAQTDGLVHISQLKSGFVTRPSEVVQVGDEVQVRILEVDQAKRRISLSMREMGDGNKDRGYQRAEPEPASEPAADMPTAFQVAWEKAQAEPGSRRRRRR